ncbi:SgrR family transcriptional regulator, partial [Salmonella enterica subsp. enterica serovar Kentucky]|nr:SgrR family transcriptional regulator [Salmonella enterica subsp. enterica serovar Kentucky]
GSSGSQIGHKESIKDTARVLGRMFDGIQYRGYGQEIVETLAEFWQSQAGRGHRARLHLRYKPEQLLSEKAEQLLESGHVDQAIQL